MRAGGVFHAGDYTFVFMLAVIRLLDGSSATLTLGLFQDCP
jgi:hypothetical protein